MNIDELIYNRIEARKSHNWLLSDKLREILDNELVFVFDNNTDRPEVYYLTEKYFKDVTKHEAQSGKKFLTRRKYVEWRIQEDIRAENIFNAWLTTVSLTR